VNTEATPRRQPANAPVLQGTEENRSGRNHAGRQCPICAGPNLVRWRIGQDRLLRVTDIQFTYLLCKTCGARFQDQPPPPSEIGRYYPTVYGPYQGASKVPRKVGLLGKISRKLIHGLTRSMRKRIARTYKPASEGLVFLDYGCGSAKVLNDARDKGWHTIGVDFAETVIAQVAAGGHRAYLASEEFWGEIPDNSVSLIRMNHVIEHLYDPKAVLGRLCRKLKPGGTLHLATPHPGGLGSRLFRSHWLGLDCPRHIVMFGPRLLERCLTEAGFGQIHILSEFVTKDFARSIGYVLADWGWLKAEKVGALADQHLLATLLILPCWMATRAGLPDRYHILAQKC
jgi:SAM-dependent methyltransferase